MESITKEQLIKDGVRHITEHEITYFPVKDILEKYPDARINQGAFQIGRNFGSEMLVSITAEDFMVMTEFDKHILQTLNFNPKNK